LWFRDFWGSPKRFFYLAATIDLAATIQGQLKQYKIPPKYTKMLENSLKYIQNTLYCNAPKLHLYENTLKMGIEITLKMH
jgi:hypothetical protein